MKLAHILGAAALLGTTLLAAAPAGAQQAIESLGITVMTTPTVASDYMFRGISQTRGGPAIQGAIDIEHSSGIYVGAFISNVAFAGTNLRQEVDATFGYRFEVAGVKLDVGGTYFGYPGYDKPPGGFEFAWWEANLRASYEMAPVKLVGLLAYAPDFNSESGTGIYIEGGVDLTLDFGFTASARVGHQWIERNARFGTPDYTVLSFGVSREIVAGFIGSVTLSHTSIAERDCLGGQSICGTRFVAALSRPF